MQVSFFLRCRTILTSNFVLFEPLFLTEISIILFQFISIIVMKHMKGYWSTVSKLDISNWRQLLFQTDTSIILCWFCFLFCYDVLILTLIKVYWSTVSKHNISTRHQIQCCTTQRNQTKGVHPWDIFLYTTEMTSQWIITQYCWNNIRHFFM